MDLSTTTTSIILILTILLLLQKLFQTKLPGPSPLPIIGGSFSFSKKFFSGKLYEIALAYPKLYGPIYSVSVIFTFWKLPDVTICDGDSIKKVLTDSFNFQKHDLLKQVGEGFFDNALFALPSGDFHKRHRKLLDPAFAPSHLRKIPGFCKIVLEDLSLLWEEEMVGNRLITSDFDDLMKTVILDVLGLAAYGRKFGAVINEKVRNESIWANLDKVTLPVMVKRIVFPKFLWGLAGISVDSSAINTSVSLMKKFFKEIEAGARIEGDDLNVMERLLISQKNGEMTEMEVYDEMLGIFVAGHDTSSHTLCFILMELAKNPDIQELLYKDIKDIDTDQADYLNTLTKLTLLENVVKETQRLHTVVAFLNRHAVKDVDVLGYTIPKGSIIWLNCRGLHRSEKYYKDADKFSPDRWNQEQVKNTFFPFV